MEVLDRELEPSAASVLPLALPPRGELRRTVLDLYGETRPILWLGLIGFVLAAICLVVLAVNGPYIAPAGKLLNPITFDPAVGVYLLTMGLLIPLAKFTEKGRKAWMATAVSMAPVAYITVTVQTLRGHNPRFSDRPDLLDWFFAQAFSLTALAVIATFVITVVWIWRRRDSWRDGPIRLSVLYAGVATVFGGFGVGVVMFFHRSRYIGGGGNLLPLHALAFHALQAVPVVAVILHRAGLRGRESHRLVHVAGISWLGLAVSVGGACAYPHLAPIGAAIAVPFAAAWVWSVVQAIQTWRVSAEASLQPS